jgi:hypothetical protein
MRCATISVCSWPLYCTISTTSGARTGTSFMSAWRMALATGSVTSSNTSSTLCGADANTDTLDDAAMSFCDATVSMTAVAITPRQHQMSVTASMYAGNTKTGYEYDVSETELGFIRPGVAASVPAAASVLGPVFLSGAGAHMLDASGGALQSFAVSQCAFGSPFLCTPFQASEAGRPRPAAGGPVGQCFTPGVIALDVRCAPATAQACYDAGGVWDSSSVLCHATAPSKGGALAANGAF